MSLTITCRNLRVHDGKKGPAVVCDLEIAEWGLVIRNCRYYSGEGKRAVIGMPQRPYVRNGEPRFENLVDFTKSAAMCAFLAAAVPAVHEALARGVRPA